MTDEYASAQKLALKEYRAGVNEGAYPYLPVLTDFVTVDRISRGIDLGLVQLPMKWLVGTVNQGRTDTFARNFMPLAEEHSEFATKWMALCRAHLEEGIRQPIKAYEYMHRYYVEEGNKRVSVLKYFGAVNVAAELVRVMPHEDGSPEVQRNLEYIQFYRYSKINFVEFSRVGGYPHLQQLVGKAPEEAWSREEQLRFSTAYYLFRKAYTSMGGQRLSNTTGDALLSYLEVYGYPELCASGESTLRQNLKKMWEEVSLRQEERPIDIKSGPEDEKKPGILTRVLTGVELKPMRVAFVHDKNPASSGWTYGHELGRNHVQEVFHGDIETTAYPDALEHDDPLGVLRTAIGDGNRVIFTTSPRLLPASLRAAVDAPETLILNCSLNTSHRYIRTYYARMYEAKFVIGAIAGALAGSDNVGYICNYPIYGQVAGIDAFALGVQMVNPRAKVILEWSSVGGGAAARRRLTDRGIRLISTQDLARLNDSARSSFGLGLVSDGTEVHLAHPVWQWGIYYETLLRRIRNKSFQTEYLESSRALNYYWGMSAGVVAVECSDRVPESIRRLAELLCQSIRSGACNPFRGPLYVQGGKKLEGEDQELNLEKIVAIDWLAENVDGSIPPYAALDETGKATVDQVGVDSVPRSE